MVRCVLKIILAGLVLNAGMLTAQSPDERLLDGLRQRELFDLARYYCQQQLQQPGSSSREQVKWTIQLMRTLGSEAQHAGQQQRPGLWDQAGEVSAAFLAEHRDNPRQILVRVHAALILLAEGELERFEAEVAVDRAAVMGRAQQNLRAAIRLLQQIERDLTPLIPQAPRQADGDRLTANELISLQNNTRYQLGRAYRNQALSYPPDGDDRIASLQRAVAEFEKPLTQLAEDDLLTAKVIGELVACLRLQGKSEPAKIQLARLEKMALPAGLLLAARAERVQLALADKDLDAAINLLQQPRRIRGVISPQLDLAMLDTFLALLDLAQQQMDKPRASGLQDQALKLVQAIRQDHGGYWGRRSEIRLVQAVGQQGGLANLGIMQKAADDLYLRGKFAEAIEGYEKAGLLAHEHGADDEAFGLLFKAALVSQKQQDFPAFVTRLNALTRLLPAHPQSSATHLKAIQHAHALGQEDQAWRVSELDMMAVHLQLWPTGMTSDQVRIWLGTIARSEQKWAEAIAHYQQVSVSDSRLPVVLEIVETCWMNLLAELDSEQQGPQLQMALAYFQSLFQDASGQLPSRWSPAARQAVLVAGRLALRFQQGQEQGVERLVLAAQQGLPAPDARFTSQANAILMVALAGQGKLDDADKLLGQIGKQDPQRIFEIMKSLADLSQRSPGGSGRLALLQLKMFERSASQRELLSPAQQLHWDLAHAQALAAADQQPDAARMLKKLAEENRKSAGVQKAYAEVLMEGADASSWQLAQDQWRRILAKSRPQDSLWYEAKYAIALAYFKLGKKREAAARIEYLQATTGLEQTTLRADFLALLAKCR